MNTQNRTTFDLSSEAEDIKRYNKGFRQNLSNILGNEYWLLPFRGCTHVQALMAPISIRFEDNGYMLVVHSERDQN